MCPRCARRVFSAAILCECVADAMVRLFAQSKRFAAQHRSHLQSTLDPGPGQYNPRDSVRRQRHFSKAATSAVFSKPRRVRGHPMRALSCAPGAQLRFQGSSLSPLHTLNARSTETTHISCSSPRQVLATTTRQMHALYRPLRRCSSLTAARARRSSRRPSATPTWRAPAWLQHRGTTHTTRPRLRRRASVTEGWRCSVRLSPS